MSQAEAEGRDRTDETAARRRAIAAFAASDGAALADAWERIGDGIAMRPVRGPEVGLVMLRGRMGGGGAPFNLGEASVTRASVKLDTGEIGHAMVLGRDMEKARLAAAFDAAWQRGDRRAAVETQVIAPALALIAGEDMRRAEETQATRVDFFTVVRGED